MFIDDLQYSANSSTDHYSDNFLFLKDSFIGAASYWSSLKPVYSLGSSLSDESFGFMGWGVGVGGLNPLVPHDG